MCFFPRAKVLHGQDWREHRLYLKAGSHPCILISNVLEEPKEATQRTSALLLVPGATWQLALVPFTQPVISLLCPRAFRCGDQSVSQCKPHAEEAHTSLNSSRQPCRVFFFSWRVLHLQGWGPGFDSSPQGRSVRQVPLPCALI